MVHHTKFTSKGVLTNSDSLPTPIHLSDSEVSTPKSSSLHRVKNEIQTVLDLMGPSTPTIQSQPNNTITTEDEEDTSISSSILKEVSSTITTQREAQMTPVSEKSEHLCSLHPTPPENEDSHLADYGSSSTLHQIDSLLSNMGCLSPNHEHDGAHICVNQQCKCMKDYLNQTFIPMVSQKVCKCVNVAQKHLAISDMKREKLLEWLKKLKSYEIRKKHTSLMSPCELYKVNIQEDGDGLHPKRLVFDLVEGIPRPYTASVATNTRRDRSPPPPIRKARRTVNRACSPIAYNMEERKTRKSRRNYPDPEKIYEEYIQQKNINNQVKEDGDKIQKQQDNQQKYSFYDSNGDTRVDFYYFDHGNAEFLNTTDSQPVMKCEVLAEKTERYTTKFWAEFFASIHIVIAFGISFLLQLFKFLLYSIIRPLTVGLTQLASDYFFKPCLTTLFNGIIQPFLIFLYNIVTTIRDLFDPIAECCGFFVRECSVLCKSIRCCSYRKTKNCQCKKDNV